ncbi:ABC transporter permease [Kitasatospora sp. NBC_01539]|uniref:ABC transporter permease n=1 Tax=Kitasatospora sp. NBC_01539 TaxID=2903577 RepID=UPI00386029E5
MPPSPDARTDADTGVIHNIGYRGYEGPRLGRAYATRSLYVQSLRAAFGLGRSGKSKVLPMAMFGLPVVIAAVMVAIQIFTGVKKPIVDYADFIQNTGTLVWIFLAAQAPVLFSRDLRHHTVPLYFSRPITRADYVRAKFAALASALFIVMAVPLLVLYLGALLGRLPFGHHTAHFLIGLAAAVLYAVLEAAIAMLIAASTPRRGFGVASIMGVLVVSSIVAGIVYGIAGGEFESPPESANWAAMLAPGMLVAGFVNQVFGLVVHPNVVHAPGAGAALLFAAEIVLLTVACYWFTDRRYRKI